MFGKNYRRYFLGLFNTIEKRKLREVMRHTNYYIDFGVNVGCGMGSVGDVGVDNNIDMLRGAETKYRVLADATNLPFKEDAFDYAFCSELLHHVEKPEQILCEMIRVSRKVIVNEANIRNIVVFMFTRFLPFDKDANFYDTERFIELLNHDHHHQKSWPTFYKSGFLIIPNVWLWGILS